MNELTGLLSAMVARDASDLYIAAEAAPALKVAGRMHYLGHAPLSAEHARQLIFSALSPRQQEDFSRNLALDIGIAFPKIGRFRLNVYSQKNSPAMVVRFIKDRIPTISELSLPDLLHDLAMEERGFVLIVGATGTGKSTTLASMVNHRNEHRAGHILTIEDPIEYTHIHKQCVVSQREVGIDTHSFADALRHGLREAPDMVVIGEVRDHDTAAHALRYAETGHLCVSTMHASNANQALDRFINLFPPEVQRQTRQDLAQHLLAILSQRLAYGLDGQRVMVMEIMMNTPYIAELIEKGGQEKIKDAMSSKDNKISQTFDDALHGLIQEGRISEKEGLRLADSRINLGLRLRMGDDNKEDQPAYLQPEKTAFDESKDFSAYQRVSVVASRGSQSRRPEMEKLLTSAIKLAVIDRGYSIDDSQPDLIIKYAFGLQHKKPVEVPLSEQEDEIQKRSNEGGLIISAVEPGGDSVWHLVASRPLGEKRRSPQEINLAIAKLMGAFPLGGKK